MNSKEYAALSKAAYGARPNNDEADLRKRLRKGGGLRRNQTDRFELVRELSNEDHVTFFDTKRNKAVVAFRGTRLDDPGDLFADLGIYFGVQRFTPRFQDALSTARAAQKMFGSENVEYTGHSLGGAQALYATSKTGSPSYAFNPGKGYHKPGILDAYDALASYYDPKFDRLNDQNATIYTTGLDPISFNSIRSPADLRLVAPSQLDVHSIDNFL